MLIFFHSQEGYYICVKIKNKKRIMKLTSLLFIVSFLMVCACKSDPKTAGKKKATKTEKSVKGNAPNKKGTVGLATKPKANAKKGTAKKAGNSYSSNLAKAIGMPAAKVSSLEAIDKKYAATTKSLKKQGKWDGDANAALRKAQNAKKETEIKALLGADLYKKKQDFDKKNKKGKKKK